MHPLAKQVQKHMLFLTLATYDSAVRPVPRLAAWEWSDDRTTLTFALRRDVRWHDGTPTTAADVIWTIRSARDPGVAYPRARDLESIRSVTRLDAFTVRVAFVRAQAVFPDVFTDLPILPAHRFAGVTDMRSAPFNADPVGNGPFTFVEHRANQRWVFRRHDSFPPDLGVPTIERVVIAIVDEPVTKLAALTSGELDFAGINPAHAGFVRADERLAVVDYPLLLSYGLVFNLRRPPFDDTRVRRALSLAVDRQLIVDAYLYGFGSPAAGPVPPAHPWYVDVPAIPFDPAAAGRLLDAAGWRARDGGTRWHDGQPLAFDLLTVGSGAMALEQMIQAQLRAVGAEVRIRQLELSSFLAAAQGDRRDFDALVTGIPGDLSLGYVAAMYDGDGPLAYPGVHDADLIDAFARVREATTTDALADAWSAVQRRLVDGAATAWIYHARGVQGVNRRVTGVHLDIRGELAGIAGWALGGR